MSSKKIQNYISLDNNAKIIFCTSENNSFLSSNILTDEEKVIKKINYSYIIFLIEFLDFDAWVTTRNNY